MPNNPYRAGTPVGDTDAFVGRTEILRTVKDTMDDLHRNAMVLYGQRRIGKTSVLKQLEALLSKKYCPIFCDWQDKADWTLQKVLEELAQIISLSLEQTKPTLSPNPQTAFKQWLADQLLNSQNRPLVFLFDEFDVIATKDIISYLGQLLTLNPQRLNCIFVVGCKVEQLTDYTLELFRVRNVESRFISLLTLTETEELIRLSEKNQTLQWSGPATKEIWRLTAGHPYFTQQLCSKVWDHLYREAPSQPPTVTLDHVNIVIPKVLEATEGILESLWRSLSHMERVVAAMLAQPQARWPEYVKPLAKIAQPLEQIRASLIKWDLVHEQRGDSRFRVEIIRRWIETHKAFYYDELDLIESHAPAIYKIAKQLYEEQYLDFAQALLEQAVQLNCYHTKANQLLAKILLEQKQREPARQVLENLYQYNPDTARDQLVQVLLELANSYKRDEETKENTFWKNWGTSHSHEETQLELYNQVLEIDPNNLTAVNGRHGILQRQQARSWKSWLKTIYHRYSKRIWETIGFFILVGGYSVFSLQVFPSYIILEIEKKGERVYWLTGVPTSKTYSLEQMTIIPPNLGSKKELLTFKYNDSPEVKLNKTEESYYLVNQTVLSETKPLVYPHKDNLVAFEFRFEFEGGVPHELPTFGCQAESIDKQSIECVSKQAGFLSVLRAMPWYGIGIPLGIFWIILVEISYALRNREKDDTF